MQNGFLALLVCVAAMGAANAPSDGPRYTPEQRLLRPDDYREWVWLSSGLGMAYGPLANQNPNENPPFDNVFVNRSAFRGFMETGRWPDKTVMVLEVRSSLSKGSINKGGHFQGPLRGIEVHVKDESRFPGKWAFFGFPSGASAGQLIPTSANCYSCHEQHGIVDTTFVQFYPTLLEVARQKGTVRSGSEGSNPSSKGTR
jgi:hypothetical protein